MLLAAVTPVQAQENIAFTIGQSTGFWTKWNNNPSNQWASQWQSTQTDPQITITHTNNNMRFWDGENIMFFSHVGGNNGQTYRFTVSTGYNIVGMSLDFTCGEVTGVVGNSSMGVSVTLNDEEVVENYSNEDFEHIEISDIEVTELAMTVTSLGESSTFANTKNLVLYLAKQTGIEVAEAEFMEILKKYELYEEDDFQVGTAPGLYGQAERDAFFAAVEAGHGIDDIPVDELTVEKYEQLGKAIIDTYDALVASRNMTYTIPEGYKFFRVRTAMTYEDETTKYLNVVRNGETFNARWGTPDADDALQQYQTLWLITPAIGGFEMINAYSEAHFNNVATSAVVTLSPESTNLMAFDPVYTDEDGITFINIRVATQEANKTFYLHQGGHGGGTGTGGNVVGWECTWSYVDGPKASEWLLEPVSDEEAAAIVEDGLTAVLRESFEDEYAKLSLEANAALAAAQNDMTATDLITSAEQFSSPWTEESEGSIEALIDNDPSTFWHSQWSAGSVDNLTHYLQVELNEPVHDLVRLKVTRRQASNDHITAWLVMGSNDPEAADEDWTPVASLATPYGNNTETVTTRGFHTKDFKYLRLYIAETTTGRGYGHAAELQLQALTVAEGSQYAAIQEEADALTAVIEKLEFIPVDEVTEEQGGELQAAYLAFRSVYVDPSDLREVIAQAEALANGIIVGTQPGYWKDNSLATALKTIVGQAKSYDEAASYTVAQSKEFVDKLNEAMAPVLEAAIGIKEGKWYTIGFGSLEDFEANGWDISAGTANMSSDDEDAIEIDGALWEKVMTVASYDSDSETGEHFVTSIATEDVRVGALVFCDHKDAIEESDLALWRFINVGDTAYVIQNKATGLFLKAAGTSGGMSVHLYPSLFNVKAIGFGQNIIAATDLNGISQNNIHFAKSWNQVVTWDAYTVGSRSGLYITETADVAADYDGTKFPMDIREGEIYTFCYPVDLALDEDNTGEMWTVNAVEGNTVRLAKLTKVTPGRPFIYIAGETEAYDPESQTSPETFIHGYTFEADPVTDGLFRGTYSTVTPGAGFIIVNETKRNSLIVSHAIMENSTVPAFQGYIAPETTPTGAIEIVLTDEEDGIQTAVANVSRTGNIYSLDGRIVARGNLNTAARLAPGIYIINGTKVAVK